MYLAVIFAFLGFPLATLVLANVHDTEICFETRVTVTARHRAALLLGRGAT
jgi:hypothetical protein